MVIASSTEAAATNVPVQATELIGRDADLDRLSGRLDKNRLITLTGPGGIGKTRLALEVARAALPKFADGVWVAELAAVTDADLVPSVVAAAIGLQFPTGAISSERLAQALA